MKKLSSVKKYVLDLIFPMHCLGCNQEGSFLCTDCLNKIPLKEKQSKDLIVASYYTHPILKEAIHRFKYSFVKELAKPLASLMVKKIQLNRELIANSVLIPVPLSKKRLAWRGFNQAQALAQVISQELNIPLAEDILIRTKHTLPQVTIADAQHRQENMQKAFEINPQSIVNLKNKTIVLIDDVCTTGATLNECSLILQQLEPKAMMGLVLAQG